MHFDLALLRTPIAFAVVLGILVFVHELGHYLAARWRGIGVEAFSIGFGRPIVAWTDRRNTVWSIGWIPLGGYVKMHGMGRPGLAGSDAAATDQAAYRAGEAFFEKSVLSRAIVVAAGPVANFLLAIVLLAFLFMTAGRPTTLPMVGEVFPNTAASAAGLAHGDRILSIDGKPMRSFGDVQRIVSTHPGATMAIEVRRDHKDVALRATIGSSGQGEDRIGKLGISGGEMIFHRLSPPAALLAGVTETGRTSWGILDGIWQMVTGQRGAGDIGGVVRIAQLSGEVAALGVATTINFIALLSINLGLINLLPIPILDGGHLLFFLAEALRGRPIPVRAQEMGLRFGLAVLVSLFLFSTWNDLIHIGLFRWVTHLIG